MGDGGESCMFKDRWWRWLCGGTEAVDLPEPGDGGVGGGPLECGGAQPAVLFGGLLSYLQ